MGNNGMNNNNVGINISQAQENELLWLIGAASFDFIVMYNIDDGVGSLVRLIDGERKAPQMVGEFEDYLLSKVHPDDLMVYQKELELLHDGIEKLDFEFRLKETRGRRYRWHHIVLRRNIIDGKAFYVGSSTYIDSRKNKELELIIKSRQDPLTGLLNKTTVKENIISYIARYPEKEGALMVLDIDNFKNYNDCIGHLFGDEIIKEVAMKLRKEFGEDSFVGRVGGDEFIVYIKDLEDISGLVNRVNSLRDSLKEIILGQKSMLNITTSIGISLFPDQGEDYDKLFACADAALYYVKNSGKNGYAVFVDDLYSSPDNFDHAEDLDEPATPKPTYTISRFAFHLLNETADANAAMNLLLYKMLNEYGVEGIYVNELEEGESTTRVTFESVRDDKYSRLGEDYEFYPETYGKRDNVLADGVVVYDLCKPTEDALNDARAHSNLKSVLKVEMRLFSQTRGCVNIISSKVPTSWRESYVTEIKSIVDLITICLYYSGRTRKAEKAVLKYEGTDVLTGLMKGDNFISAAGKYISRNGNNKQLVMVYFALSNFKEINDSHGYIVGDLVIKDLAASLSNKIRGVVCAGRLYSDNFLCLCEFSKGSTRERIFDKIDSYNLALAGELCNKYNVPDIYLRAGIYIIPNSEADPLRAVSLADKARKEAQPEEGKRCVIFDSI